MERLNPKGSLEPPGLEADSRIARAREALLERERALKRELAQMYLGALELARVKRENTLAQYESRLLEEMGADLEGLEERLRGELAKRLSKLEEAMLFLRGSLEEEVEAIARRVLGEEVPKG